MNTISRPFGCRLGDDTRHPGDQPGDRICGIAIRKPGFGIQVRIRTNRDDPKIRHLMLTPVRQAFDGVWTIDKHRGSEGQTAAVQGLKFPVAMLSDIVDLLELAEDTLSDEAAA